MSLAQHTLAIRTRGQGLHEVTREIAAWVAEQAIDHGLLTVFCQHTSASLTIQENADPDVRSDIEAFFRRLVREDPTLYRHTVEGPDDIASMVTFLAGDQAGFVSGETIYVDGGMTRRMPLVE